MISSREPSPAPKDDVPGPSRFPGAFEDAGGPPPAGESFDGLDAALLDLDEDVSMLRRAGIAMVEFADEMAAHMAVFRNRLDERLAFSEASGKGKGKARE